MPAFVRWPGQIPGGQDAQRHRLAPGLAADAARRGRRARHQGASCSKGHEAGEQDLQGPLDGYNMLPYLTGETEESPRDEFFYVNDDGQLVALRYRDWKLVFMEQRAKTLALLGGALRAAARARRSSTCGAIRSSAPTRTPTPTGTGCSTTPSCWCPRRRTWRSMIAVAREFPPRQKPASFNLDRVLETLQNSAGAGAH